MKNLLVCILMCLLFCVSCKKIVEGIMNRGTDSNTTDAAGFTKYTIKSGHHSANGNTYKTIETNELKFIVKFDSSAIYLSGTADNQFDINKLYGFSDNNAHHHEFSARFGWRWSNNALRLFGYVYNDREVISEELATVSIGSEITCSIKITAQNYLFEVNQHIKQMPRTSATPTAKGYQLYPYFGGDEVAPHDIAILVKTL